ncbi:hypothetical protein IAI10_03110 [Clostridium sp. 19966]|uniref:hypothetical protein n=1 Tax=Clostridium sp. 19966 TaxID=2768166 RepID=UPI0028DFF276|nr:hypothetical protein [Clostridium sp. 19966]MDT8715648.1 hypothetical protein [Clostridium sp. 19966]
MVLFLIIGIAISVLFISAVLTMQTKKLKKNNRKADKALQILFIKDMFVMAIIMILTVIIIPYSIWIFGHKGMVDDEVVKEQKNIYVIDSNSKLYVKKNVVDIDGVQKEYYLVNINEYIRQLDAFECGNTEIIEQRGTDPKYYRVALYKNYKLLGKDIISKSVNDMFSNIYLYSGKAQYIKDIIRIYVPNS